MASCPTWLGRDGSCSARVQLHFLGHYACGGDFVPNETCVQMMCVTFRLMWLKIMCIFFTSSLPPALFLSVSWISMPRLVLEPCVEEGRASEAQGPEKL